ncbi:hypothetical protein CHR60_00425, partial [Faecalibacterium prausnitzii]
PQHPELIVAFRWRAVYKYYYFIIRGDNMKKNKWVLLLIAFVAFLVLVYFIGACLNATAEALTIISLCIGILVIYLVVKAIKSK